MTALTTVAVSRQVYPKFPVARKLTPLLASPADVDQDVLIFRSRSSHRSSIRLRLPLSYLKKLDSLPL